MYSQYSISKSTAVIPHTSGNTLLIRLTVLQFLNWFSGQCRLYFMVFQCVFNLMFLCVFSCL